MEALTFRNRLRAAVGQEMARRCSIPQGCPMSMMALALVMTGWQAAIQELHPMVASRTLADDMQLETVQDQREIEEAQIGQAHLEAICTTAEFATDL
eukprot:2027773-Alexandrium_andersonii.AAC.1